MSVQTTQWMETALWLTVIASGVYHGVNPGMGWPLAVSAGLMGKGRRDLIASLGPLGTGHFLAMAGILTPFAVMTALVAWQREIRTAAGLLVIAAGVYLLVGRRHPRFLARIKPTQLALWSFAVATAHGAGLMLLPIYLGICAAGEQDAGHQAAAALMRGNLGTAIAVSFVHATAMIVSGGVVAFAVHEWLGLRFISKSWFNLDVVWALSLIFVGAIGVTNAAARALRQQSIESREGWRSALVLTPAAAARHDPRTSSGRCRGLSARHCSLPPARQALQSRRVQPRGRSSASAKRACNRIWDRLRVAVRSVDRGDKHAVNGRLEVADVARPNAVAWKLIKFLKCPLLSGQSDPVPTKSTELMRQSQSRPQVPGD